MISYMLPVPGTPLFVLQFNIHTAPEDSDLGESGTRTWNSEGHMEKGCNFTIPILLTGYSLRPVRNGQPVDTLALQCTAYVIHTCRS